MTETAEGGKKTRRGPKRPIAPARKQALACLLQVADGQSLATAWPARAEYLADGCDRALAQELVYGVLRWQWRLDALLRPWLKKPLKKKDGDIRQIMRLAAYELLACRSPAYAVINDAVELAKSRRKPWAGGLLNAVLRRGAAQWTQRPAENGMPMPETGDEEALWSHPQWLIDRLRADWPQHWQAILRANNARPPMWLRVNRRRQGRDDYRGLLRQAGIDSRPDPAAADALCLAQAGEVSALPGFEDGLFSVQDAGAQLAADWLPVAAGDAVLDVCAAPGGKTCHLLERHPALGSLLAVDNSASRMQRLEQNLARLQLTAQTRVCDARALPDLLEAGGGRTFGQILLDAPCSATGVIRRHPDIKHLRKADDIAALAALQRELLDALWPLLAPGGHLLYVTCSVLREENEAQIKAFLRRQETARECVIDAEWGQPCTPGRQLLPGDGGRDGFYYCLLRKHGGGA